MFSSHIHIFIVGFLGRKGFFFFLSLPTIFYCCKKQVRNPWDGGLGEGRMVWVGVCVGVGD